MFEFEFYKVGVGGSIRIPYFCQYSNTQWESKAGTYVCLFDLPVDFLYHCRRTVLSIYKKYPGIPNMV